MRPYLILSLCCLIFSGAYAQQNSVGIFQHYSDIGNPKVAGTTVYNESNRTYTLNGAGYNIWFDRDEFQYAYKKMKGNFTITATFQFVGEGTDLHRKVGWMVRESTEPDAAHYSAVLHGDGLTVFQWRTKKGALMRDPEDEIFAAEKNYQIIQLQREGKKLTMRAAYVGKPLQMIGTTEMENMPDDVLIGLFICSHNPDVKEAAQVSNVAIKKMK